MHSDLNTTIIIMAFILHIKTQYYFLLSHNSTLAPIEETQSYKEPDMETIIPQQWNQVQNS